MAELRNISNRISPPLTPRENVHRKNTACPPLFLLGSVSRWAFFPTLLLLGIFVLGCGGKKVPQGLPSPEPLEVPERNDQEEEKAEDSADDATSEEEASASSEPEEPEPEPEPEPETPEEPESDPQNQGERNADPEQTENAGGGTAAAAALDAYLAEALVRFPSLKSFIETLRQRVSDKPDAEAVAAVCDMLQQELQSLQQQVMSIDEDLSNLTNVAITQIIRGQLRTTMLEESLSRMMAAVEQGRRDQLRQQHAAALKSASSQCAAAYLSRNMRRAATQRNLSNETLLVAYVPATERAKQILDAQSKGDKKKDSRSEEEDLHEDEYGMDEGYEPPGDDYYPDSDYGSGGGSARDLATVCDEALTVLFEKEPETENLTKTLGDLAKSARAKLPRERRERSSSEYEDDYYEEDMYDEGYDYYDEEDEYGDRGSSSARGGKKSGLNLDLEGLADETIPGDAESTGGMISTIKKDDPYAPVDLELEDNVRAVIRDGIKPFLYHQDKEIQLAAAEAYSLFAGREDHLPRTSQLLGIIPFENEEALRVFDCLVLEKAYREDPRAHILLLETHPLGEEVMLDYFEEIGTPGQMAVAQLLQAASAPTRGLALKVLWEIGDADVAPAVAMLAEDPKAPIRQAAMQLLGRIGDNRVAPAIAKKLLDPAEQENAKKLLITMGYPVEPTVLKGLQANNPELEQICAEILREIGTWNSLTPLGGILYKYSDPNREADAVSANEKEILIACLDAGRQIIGRMAGESSSSSRGSEGSSYLGSSDEEYMYEEEYDEYEDEGYYGGSGSDRETTRTRELPPPNVDPGNAPYHWMIAVYTFGERMLSEKSRVIEDINSVRSAERAATEMLRMPRQSHIEPVVKQAEQVLPPLLTEKQREEILSEYRSDYRETGERFQRRIRAAQRHERAFQTLQSRLSADPSAPQGRDGSGYDEYEDDMYD